MANQTIPNSNGDYLENAVAGSWGKIESSKLPSPFVDILRNVWTLNGLSYGVPPDVVFGDVFSWELDIRTTLATSKQLMLGSDYQSQYYLRLNTHNTMRLFIASASHSFILPASIDDGEWHNLKLEFNGLSVVVTMDGVAQPAVVLTQLYYGNNDFYIGGNPVIDRVFVGSIANVKINGAVSVGGDTNVNSLHYKLDEPYSDDHLAYDANGFASIGADFSDISEWETTTYAVLSVVDEELKVTTTKEAQGAYLSFSTLAGKDYTVSVKAGEVADGSLVRVGAGNTAGSGSLDVPVVSHEEVSFTFTASASTSYIYLRNTFMGTSFWSTVAVGQSTAMQKYNDLPEDYTQEIL